MNTSFLNNKNLINKETWMNNPFLTEDYTTTQNEEYYNITRVLLSLISNGSVRLMDGYCLTACETIRTALKSFGIESKIYECQCSLIYTDVEPPVYWFIGFDNLKKDDEVDTHLILITETKIPFIIDASISSKLPISKPVIVDVFKDERNEEYKIMSSYEMKEFRLRIVYQQKQVQKMARNIQTSIIDRIKTDKKIFEQIEVLKKLNYIGIFFGIFSLIAVIHQFFRWWIYG